MRGNLDCDACEQFPLAGGESAGSGVVTINLGREP